MQLGFVLLALIWEYDFPPFMVLIIAILNDGNVSNHVRSYSSFLANMDQISMSTTKLQIFKLHSYQSYDYFLTEFDERINFEL